MSGGKARRVTEPGRLFRVEGHQALDYHLADDVVDNFEEFKRLYSLEKDPQLVEPGWADTLIDALRSPGVTWFLLLLGLAALYAELQSPGIGVGAFISAVCFVLFFWGNYLGGTAGWLEVLLFALGVACLTLEIFVLPGFGIFGLGGAALILVSVLLATQTFVGLPQNEYQAAELQRGLTIIAAAGVGAILLISLVHRYLPRAPVFNRMVLAPPSDHEAAEISHRESLAHFEHLVGREGTTLTRLAPAGKAQHRWRAVQRHRRRRVHRAWPASDCRRSARQPHCGADRVTWGRHSCLPSLTCILADRNVCPTCCASPVLPGTISLPRRRTLAVSQLSSRHTAMDPLLWASLLMLLALALVMLEVFVPSGGVIGVLAALSVLGSVGMAFYRGPGTGLAFLAGALIALPSAASLRTQDLAGDALWPSHPAQASHGAGGACPTASIAAACQELVGKVGRAKSLMLPSGAAEIGGRTVRRRERGSGHRAWPIGARRRSARQPCGGAACQRGGGPPDGHRRHGRLATDDVLSQPIDRIGLDPFEDPIA